MQHKEDSEMCVNIEQVEKVVESRAKNTELEMRGQFNLINEKLDRISESGNKTLEQATRTNGRVNTHESKIRDLQEQNRNHHVDCPLNEPVRELQDKSITNTAVVNTIWKVGVGLGALITFLMTLFGFLAGYI